MVQMNKQTYQDIEETVHSKKLDNGLTVILLRKPEMSKTYSLFSTKYGSIDQTFTPIGEKEMVTVPDGVAHFLEHKLFEKEDRDVFADFGRQGASPNAYTSFTNTAYLFSATDNIEQNVETLLDFVQEPYFSEQSVEKEKGIIKQEIMMYDDQPDWQAMMGTIKSLFKNHPVKTDIAGTVASIETITKDDLYTCYHTFYHPENMTLFIAGNFAVEEMMAMIETNQANKSFTKMDEIMRDYPEEPEEVAIKKQQITMPVSIPKCMVGIKESSEELSGAAFIKKDLLQGMIVEHYFSKSGAFYQELYAEQLIDASFEFSTSLEANFGFTMIGENTKQPDAFANKVKELLISTQTASLTEEEFATMKKKEIGQMLRAMNSLEYIANQYTHYHSFGVDLFTIIPEIQSLTLEDANDFLQHWIHEDRLAVCEIVGE